MLRYLPLICIMGPLMAAGQTGKTFDIFRYEGCSGDAAPDEVYSIDIPPEGRCSRAHVFIPGWDVDPDTGNMPVFYNGNGIEPGCYVTVDRGTDPASENCGESFVTFESGTCRSLSLPADYGIRYCCQSEGCSFFYPGRRDLTNENRDPAPARDVTLVKRSAPLISRLSTRQDECTFEPDGNPYNSRGAQQPLGNTQTCLATANQDCEFQYSRGYTRGSSQTFGASAEASVSLFEIISASVSFSYDYTYEESRNVVYTHTQKVPPGVTGYATYTELLECVSGVWRGDCDWDVDVEGEACIPKADEPGGIFGFVQTA